MSNKNRHDIDFFRGNLSKEELDRKKREALEDSYTFSDFNFKKKDKEKIEAERLRNDQLHREQIQREQLHCESLRREKENRLKEEELRRLQEQEYNRRRQEEMQEQLENNERQRTLQDGGQRRNNVDPKIASGERKPLKPKRETMPSNMVSNDNRGGRFLPKKPKQKRGHSRLRKNILRVLIVILLLLIAFIAGLFIIRNTASPVHLVVIGVDQRANQAETEIRADALMSVNAGSKSNKIIMGSIPRDTYTYIPCEEQKDKITHAYSYGATYWADKGGGIACTVESVQELTSIGNDKYVKVNFDQMMSIIDAIGGIDLTATATFHEQNSKGSQKNGYDFVKGKTYHMNGEQALAYSRHRKSDNDIERGLRQQEVFKAMFKRVKTAKFWQWPGIYLKVSKMVKTNLSQIQMLQIAMIYATNGEMENYKFDWSPAYYNGVSYVELGSTDVKEFGSKVNALR